MFKDCQELMISEIFWIEGTLSKLIFNSEFVQKCIFSLTKKVNVSIVN